MLKISETDDLCDVEYLTADELTSDMLPFPGEYLDYEEEENDRPIDALLEVYKNASVRLGVSQEDIRAFSPHHMRNHMEKRSGEKIRFESEFPTIGRGNVLRDSIITREEIDREIDGLLRTGINND